MIAHAVASPPQVIRSRVIDAMAHSLPRGTVVPGRQVTTRTLRDGSFGVGLAVVARLGATYPAQTTDGGRVWRINGPVVFTDTADAPLAVGPLQAATRSLQFTTGALGNVIDTTADGGRVWRRVLFSDGVPVAVVRTPSGGGILADVQTDDPYRHVTTLQYVSRDDGETWRLSTVLGGGSGK